MSSDTVLTREFADTLLDALDGQLALSNTAFELVIVGGSALLALGLVDRVTRDVDVVALRREGSLTQADPFPDALAVARDRVARDFLVPTWWLNPGPSSLMRFGLPKGFESRLVPRIHGSHLTVHYAGRLDLIHLKLFAMVDQGPGRHEADLRALWPTPAELIEAARWTRTHDPSPGFRSELVAAIEHLGVEAPDVDG